MVVVFDLLADDDAAFRLLLDHGRFLGQMRKVTGEILQRGLGKTGDQGIGAVNDAWAVHLEIQGSLAVPLLYAYAHLQVKPAVGKLFGEIPLCGIEYHTGQALLEGSVRDTEIGVAVQVVELVRYALQIL